MNRSRLFAAVVVLVVLIASVGLALTLDSEYRPQVALARPITTTTTEADIAALVQSGASPTLPAEEREFTEESISRASSTTTTSTIPASTTTEPATAESTATTLASRPADTADSPPTSAAPPAATPSTAPPQTAPSTTSPPTTAPPTTAAGGYVSGAEGDFASRINSFRGSNGQGGLSRSGSLDSYARSWAKKMAGSGGLSHSNLSALLPPWASAGENVGVGGSVGSIFDALASSSGHRGNMLGDFTHMGVGVYQDSDGALWTAHVFTR